MHVLLLLVGTAMASPRGPPDEDDRPPDEEIVVKKDRVAAAWAAIDARMKELGYVKRERDGRTVYAPVGNDRWKPRLIVDHDGWMRFRSPAIVWFPDRFGGTITGRRILQGHEAQLTSAVFSEVRELADALAEAVHAERLAALPDRLERVWVEGIALDGALLPDPATRRAALLDLWATRTRTPEGEAVRDVVDSFLRQVVEMSEHPLTDLERRDAAMRCGCGRVPAE